MYAELQVTTNYSFLRSGSHPGELALQCGRPVHDCFYAACAEAASATLVTADETFLRALQAEGVAIRGVPLARIHELAAA